MIVSVCVLLGRLTADFRTLTMCLHLCLRSNSMRVGEKLLIWTDGKDWSGRSVLKRRCCV